MIANKQQLKTTLERAVEKVSITDVHTHIYSAGFGELLLWGIDELVTYHYLIAEYFRYSSMDYDQFFQLSKKEQADLIWQTLFVKHSPVSEAQRGVLTVLAKLGLDTSSRDLNAYREYFAKMSTEEYIDKVFEISGVKCAVMTNDPFDAQEKAIWDTTGNTDPRFRAALRVDPLLNDFENACSKLAEWGYKVEKDLGEDSIAEVKRFLKDWVRKMDALYLAVSLPPNFIVPENSLRSRLVEMCVLPICRELDIPFAMMIGVKKLVNYKLRLAGDSLGKAEIGTVEYLCKNYPNNKFLVTILSKENQHELAITARKFRNLMIFGCWWFLNNPSIVNEITRLRIETLGLAFIPQHSDARVLDQLVYKWDHSRKTIASVLYDKYSDLMDTGWAVSEDEIERDVNDLFNNNFWNFLGRN